MRVRLSILLVVAAAIFAVAATPALAVKSCKSKYPIYSLKTYGSGKAATCSSALTISGKLAKRYKKPSQFHGSKAKKAVHSTDKKGRLYSCKWTAGSKNHKYILWTCTRGYVNVTWIWRVNR